MELKKYKDLRKVGYLIKDSFGDIEDKEYGFLPKGTQEITLHYSGDNLDFFTGFADDGKGLCPFKDESKGNLEKVSKLVEAFSFED